jgi:murein DD-endopeptidase MepM/ murein hydrolase activator NlpD
MGRYVLDSGKMKTILLQMALIMSLGAQPTPPSPLAPTRPAAPPTFSLYLPTENRGLFTGQPTVFFQPTISKRLNSAQFGFVRSTHPAEPPPYFDHFHEGIDIRPLRRDGRGKPLDPVRAAAAGEIAYANDQPHHSNYGRYLMLRHRLENTELFTTYAHLASIRQNAGAVKAGDLLGILGYTGAGINQARAHLHFEVGFMVNRHFISWFERFGKKSPSDINRHGLYSGKNFLGFDPTPLFRATADRQPMTVREIFSREQPCFHVRVPAGKAVFDWQQRFPEQTARPLSEPLPPAWEITCNRIGLPLRFEPSTVATTEPVLTWFDWSRNFQDSFTRGLVERRGQQAKLTKEGRLWFSLLTYLPEKE